MSKQPMSDQDDYTVSISGAFLSAQVEKIDAIGALLNRLAEGDDELASGLKLLAKSLSEVASDLHEVKNMPATRQIKVAFA